MSDIIGIAVFALILLALSQIYRSWQRHVNYLNAKKLKRRSEYDSLANLAAQINKRWLEISNSHNNILENILDMVSPNVRSTKEASALSDVEREVSTSITKVSNLYNDYMRDVLDYNTRMETFHFDDERYLPDGVSSTLPRAFKERLF